MLLLVLLAKIILNDALPLENKLAALAGAQQDFEILAIVLDVIQRFIKVVKRLAIAVLVKIDTIKGPVDRLEVTDQTILDLAQNRVKVVIIFVKSRP